MPLITSDRFQLVPDVSTLTQQLGKALGQRAERDREDRLLAEKQQAEKLQQSFKTTGAQFLRVRGLGDFISQRSEIAKMGQAAVQRGEDAALFTEALNINNQDELNLFLTRVATAAGNADKLIAEGLKADEEQFEPVLDAEGNVIAQRNIQTGQVIADPRAGLRAKGREKALKDDLKATKDKFDQSAKLRAEITKASTDFNKQRGAWARVEASAKDPSPAGDLALIFNFMKVLDPGSTVREGEFAQVGAAGNLPTQIQRMYEQYAEGQKLTSSQRADVVDRAKRIFTSAEKINKKDVSRIISIGKDFGIPKKLLLGAEREQGDDLTADERAELDQLRKRFPK